MSDIKVKAINQNLILTDMPDIFSGDVNTDRFIVDFDNKWNGFTKTAVFYVSENNVYKVLLNDNSCIIPKEVLKDSGKFYFGVIGVDGDKVLTSEVLTYKIGKGAITSNTVTPEPTPDIYEQILGDYNEIKKLAKEWDEKVNPAIQEATNARNQCLDAIASLHLEIMDLNGGDPLTSVYEEDVNGGYPT